MDPATLMAILSIVGPLLNAAGGGAVGGQGGSGGGLGNLLGGGAQRFREGRFRANPLAQVQAPPTGILFAGGSPFPVQTRPQKVEAIGDLLTNAFGQGGGGGGGLMAIIQRLLAAGGGGGGGGSTLFPAGLR